MGYIDRAIDFVAGAVLGVVWPPGPTRPLPDFDARTHAVRRLCDFVALLDFSRTGSVPGQQIAYRIPREQCFEEQPDDPTLLKFPSVAVLPGRGVHDNWRLGPVDLVDDTRDKYGRGTALADLGEYVEPLMLEAWGNNPAERRSVLAGVEAVVRLGQRSSALRLSLPGYFDQVATFALNESQYVDDPDVVRGRRRGQVLLELRVREVLLVDAVTLRPYVASDVATAWGDPDP
jgi:hypothetical protein